MRLHAAMMTQNELPYLIYNINRLLPGVDSVTIVDGGSTDQTIIYMRNWSKIEPKIRFFLHPWKDNFPAQRNNYLMHIAEIAQENDFIFVCDPDEILDEAGVLNLRNLF